MARKVGQIIARGDRFAGDSSERTAVLKEAMQSLDQGKGYVFKGYAWLEQELFGPSPTK
jgi:hypothetical protein